MEKKIDRGRRGGVKGSRKRKERSSEGKLRGKRRQK